MKKCVYEKVITEIINRENEQFENMLDTPVKNLVISILQSVQSMVEEEKKKQQVQEQEEVIIDRFYSDLPKEEAVALMYEILDNIDVVMASKLSRMFVNNRIPVDRIKHLIEYYKNEHKTYEIRAE